MLMRSSLEATSIYNRDIDPSFKRSRATLTSSQKNLQLYCKLYSIADIADDSDLYLSSMYMRHSHVTVNRKHLGSRKSKSASSSTVMALWNVVPCRELR